MTDTLSAPRDMTAPSTSQRGKPPLRIALLWHSLQSDNLGVGALTIAQMSIVGDIVREIGRDVHFDVVGFGGGSHYPPADVACTETLLQGSRNLLPGSPLWNAIKRADLVLDIGAGDSFTDIYGTKRFLWIWVPKVMALLQRKPLVLAPQTIGPFKGSLTARAAAFVMRRSRKVFARDSQSKAVLDKERLGDRAAETVDVAFRLPFHRRTRTPDGRIRFGFNVSGLLYAGGYTGKNQFGIKGDYKALVDTAIQRLQQRGDIDIVLVPHVISTDQPNEDDAMVSAGIAEKFPGVTVAPRFGSPSEAKSFISGLDILAGSRMHATIAACSAGVAVVPLAYSRKFSGVFRAVEYPLVGDCTTQTEGELIELILGAVDRIDELRTAAIRANEIAQAKLEVYSDLLGDVLRPMG